MLKTEEKQNKKPKKKTERYFYHKLWIWITISIVLCCVNIGYAIWGCDTENKSDILTAISGWISGVATLVIGIIAYRQSEKYKLENDKIEEKQRQRDWRGEQKDIVKLYLDNIVKAYEDLKQYQYSKIIEEVIRNKRKGVFALKEMIYDQSLKDIYDNFVSIAVNSIYYFEGIEELLDLYEKYCFQLRGLIKRIVEVVKTGEVESVFKLQNIYKDLLDKFHRHIAKVQIFLTQTLTNASFDKAQKVIEEKRVKQIEWRDKIKKAFEEVNKND